MSAVRGKESLAVALDLPPVEARELGALLAGEVGFLKVGLSLFCAEGPAVVSALKEWGARVFLDLKLHDIPNTVAGAARAVSGLGIDLLTVHAAGGEAMVEAAVKGAEAGASGLCVRPPRILAVTVLTSLDGSALERIGLVGTPEEAVVRLARLAIGAGAGGIVCSPREAKAVRAAIGTGPLIVTPGIRLSGAPMDDQARAETPSAAMGAGADVLVVGRPILQAANPISAARAILEEIWSAAA
jgi:orotidine-5'-phosphate decarboxylase